MKSLQRESNIELLRIVAMFLIVLHHCAYHGFDCPPILDVIKFGGGVGVNVFVLISGYFMVRHASSLKKLIRLYLEVFFFCVCGYLYYIIFVNHGPVKGIVTNISYFMPILSRQYWFVSAYFAILLCAPWINLLIEHLNRAALLKLLLVLFVFCTLFASLPFQGPGMGTFAQFVMLYLLGAYIRLYVNPAHISCRWSFVLFCCVLLFQMGGVVGCDILHISSLKALLLSKYGVVNMSLSVLLFLGFMRCRLPLCPTVNCCATATFGVYLIHEHPLLRSLIWHDLLGLRNVPLNEACIIYAVLSSIGVYVACTLIALMYKYSVEKAYIRWGEPKLLPCVESFLGWVNSQIETNAGEHSDKERL